MTRILTLITIALFACTAVRAERMGEDSFLAARKERIYDNARQKIRQYGDTIPADSLATILGEIETEMAALQVRQNADTIPADSLAIILGEIEREMEKLRQPEKKKHFGHRFVDYFREGNKNNDKKAFNYRLILGPHYNSTDGFGIGICGTGIYSWDRADKTLPLSNVITFGDFTTKGLVRVGIRGTNFLPGKRFKWEYVLDGCTFPTEFYGMGFANGDRDVMKTTLRRNRFIFENYFLFRLKDNLYLGPHVSYDWLGAAKVKLPRKDAVDAVRGEGTVGLPVETHPELVAGEDGTAVETMVDYYDTFDGQKRKTGALSLGATLTYDSRDFTLNAQRGIFLQLDQTVSPACFSNMERFATTEVTFDIYRKLWKGAVIAYDLHGQFVWGERPYWNFMSELGNPKRMRGYYEARYRDRHLVETQIELRQRIWRRWGMVVWGGCGEIFDKKFKKDFLLPTFGIGARWEFIKNVNIRLDYGFTKIDGKLGGGVLFSMNEAF